MSNQNKKAVAVRKETTALTDYQFLDEKQVQLIKEIYGKGLTDDEFKLFVYVCNHVGLDPMLKEIYAIKYGNNPMSIVTAIDGYRKVAESTGNYCPGKSPKFEFDKDGNLYSATAYIKKRTDDGVWHEIEATAFYSEYVQTTKEGKPNRTWATRPKGQLAKCAEALCLRLGFRKLSAIRTEDEMGKVIDTYETINAEQVQILSQMIGACSEETKQKFMAFIKNPPIGAEKLEDIPTSHFDKIYSLLEMRYKEALAKKIDVKPLDTSFDPDAVDKEFKPKEVIV